MQTRDFHLTSEVNLVPINYRPTTFSALAEIVELGGEYIELLGFLGIELMKVIIKTRDIACQVFFLRPYIGDISFLHSFLLNVLGKLGLCSEGVAEL